MAADMIESLGTQHVETALEFRETEVQSEVVDASAQVIESSKKVLDLCGISGHRTESMSVYLVLDSLKDD